MEIAEIKSQLSILTVLGHQDIKPNRNKMISCPFHADKTPSMQVQPETNTVFALAATALHGRAMNAITEKALTRIRQLQKPKLLC